MGERGVSSIIVVIVVVIAIAAAALGGYYLGTRRGVGPGSLSKYSGSQGWNIPSTYRENIPAGNVNFAGYTVSGVSVQDLLDWYKGQMTSWTLEDEVTNTSIGGITIGALIYVKGNDSAGIIVMSGAGLPNTCYILATGSELAIVSTVDLLVPRGAPPNALISVTATKVDSTHYILTISHEGGDDLTVADLQVMSTSDSSGTMQTLPFLNSSGGTTGTFSVGMKTTITCVYNGGDSAGKLVTVYIIDKPSKEKIFSSSTVAVQGTPSAPEGLLSVTAHKVTSTSYTITISHEGGDDMNVADLQVQASSSSSGTLQTLPFLNSSGGTTGTFSVGMTTTITCSYSPDVTGQVVTVYIIHKPNGEKIFASSTVAVQEGGYPAISAVVATSDNQISITVLSGSIPAGQWAYSVSSEAGSYNWITGTQALSAPSVSLGTYAYGTWYVNVKHIGTGHIYFNPDINVWLSRPPTPTALLSVVAHKVTSTSYTLTISHEGGDDLSISDLEIMASMNSENMATYPFPGTGTFSVGMQTTITCSYSPDVTGLVVTVYIIHNPSKQKIFASSTVAVQ